MAFFHEMSGKFRREGLNKGNSFMRTEKKNRKRTLYNNFIKPLPFELVPSINIPVST